MDQEVDFTAVKHLHEVHGFVPQQKENGFDHPLLACNINDVDHDLVGWKDEFKGFDHHNLVQDARSLVGGDPQHHIFSIVKQWKTASAATTTK